MSTTTNGSSESKRLRCTIIGAGVSGLLIAYKLRKHLSEQVDFTVYEKSPELGGTWYENKYPGCACDVPSHVYQYPFALNPSWSKFYASSQEIQEYLKSVAQHFDLERFIQFNSSVISAVWSDSKATWSVTVSSGENGTRTTESEILINAGGILNNPQIPTSIPGLSSFGGPQLHTAAWDSSTDLTGQRVAIIGAGASSVQLLPQIQPLCSHINVYIRTPSWITAPAGLSAEAGNELNHVFTEAEKTHFRVDGENYLETRKGLEGWFNGMFRAFFKKSDEQKSLRSTFEKRMKELIPDEQMQDKLIPKFEVGCRRINPGEQYLVALQEPNVQPIFDPIERITPGGVVVAGVEHPADVLITATGFDTTFRPRFPIVGRDGVNLQDLWAEIPVSYMGTGVAGFPNYLIFLGPNTPISNGSLMGSLEATSDYFIRLLRKVIRQQVKSFDVRPDAQADFDQHTQTYMKDMVWTGTCRSWFKPNGQKVTALWPGSSLHYMQTLAEDRWEDYKWEQRPGQTRYAYWGPGISWIEDASVDPFGADESESRATMTTIPTKGSDTSFYLKKCQPLPVKASRSESATGAVDVPDGGVDLVALADPRIAVPV